MIDVHSDTVTQPTKEMRDAMYIAKCGDDVSEEDPTVIQLEERVASMFNKEAALFFPSGTMSNLTAVLTWCHRGSEIIVGDKSHMFLFEQAGASQFGGVSFRTVPNQDDGTMKIDGIKHAIRDMDIHEPITKLICIEHTHNACGGKVLPLLFLQDVYSMAHEKKIPIHMDGARIWNALIASKTKSHEVGMYADSISVCLSKGLGCPIGSLLIGSKEFIRKARRIRKGLGGGMRQVGIIAAAGLVALDDFESGIIEQDHIRTKYLEDMILIRDCKSFRFMTSVSTNMIFLNVLIGNSSEVYQMLKDRGVIISAWSHDIIRIVIHRDITDDMIETIGYAFQEVSEELENRLYSQL